MQTPQIRKYCGATALVASLIGASSTHAAIYAYEGFDYAAGSVSQPTAVAPPTGGLAGGTGFSGTGEQWGVTYGANNTSVITGSNARFAVGANSTIVASAQQQILGNGLTYPGLPTTGGALQVTAIGPTPTNTSASIGRHFGQIVDSGTFYFSYLVQKNADTVRTTGFSFFGVTTGTTAPTERLSIGQVGNNFDYYNASGVLTNAGPVTATVPLATNLANKGDFQVALQGTVAAANSIYKGNGIIERNAVTNPNGLPVQPLTLNQTFLVVGKLDFNVGINGTDDRLTLFLNPTDLASEGANTAYFTATGFDLGQLTGFRVFAGNNQTGFLNGTAINGGEAYTYTPASATYDEFRFGTSLNEVVSVVPEPTTAALGGLGLLGILLRRRRN